MAFACPACAVAGALEITHRLELPPDSRSDEITLQVVACSRCRFAGIALYEESRRGVLDDESFDHVGYRAAPAEVAEIRRLITACPQPKNRRCTCPSHQELARTEPSGRIAIVGRGDAWGRFPVRR